MCDIRVDVHISKCDMIFAQWTEVVEDIIPQPTEPAAGGKSYNIDQVDEVLTFHG